MMFSRGMAPCNSALLCVLLLVFIVTMATGFTLTNQQPCLAEGGMCVSQEFCDEDKKINKTGLCPEHEIANAVCCTGRSRNITSRILNNEHACLAEGGMCVIGEFCEEDKRINKKGLCPEQEPNGAVCCNGVPIGEPFCVENGGMCRMQEECQNVKKFGRLNCPEGKECCLLIF